jgi:hypothetical protein
MCFSISLIINLKKSNALFLENIIIENSNVSNVSNVYNDYELMGINNYIKTNNKIIILEFEEIENIINFLELIKNVRDIKIEYIYNDNNILYARKKYLDGLNKLLFNKTELINKIDNNNKKKEYNKIYKLLKNNRLM